MQYRKGSCFWLFSITLKDVLDVQYVDYYISSEVEMDLIIKFSLIQNFSEHP